VIDTLKFKIEATALSKASAVKLRENATGDGNNVIVLEWLTKVDFLADETKRSYEQDNIAADDEQFRGNSEALERASAALEA
jgi:hypothetical protein